MKEHDKDPKFNVTEVQAIEWLFRGGLTLEHIWDSFSSRPTSILAKALRKFRPTHVYLEIGTNELKTATHNEACAIQAYISDCVQWVLSRGVKCVILRKILHRLPDLRNIPHTAKYDQGLVPAQFEENRQLVACGLQRSLPTAAILWAHLQLEGANRFICDDGVHLNIKGLKIFYFSVRGAILRMKKS